jgi:hypothetical protein
MRGNERIKRNANRNNKDFHPQLYTQETSYLERDLLIHFCLKGDSFLSQEGNLENGLWSRQSRECKSTIAEQESLPFLRLNQLCRRETQRRKGRTRRRLNRLWWLLDLLCLCVLFCECDSLFEPLLLVERVKVMMISTEMKSSFWFLLQTHNN